MPTGQPHTSAGRVPTDAGYRYFVDKLLPAKREARAGLQLSLVRREVDEAMRVTTETLSQVTNLLAIVSVLDVDAVLARRPRVALVDGTAPTLEEMARRHQSGEVFWGYSIGANGRLIVTLLDVDDEGLVRHDRLVTRREKRTGQEAENLIRPVPQNDLIQGDFPPLRQGGAQSMGAAVRVTIQRGGNLGQDR